MATTEELLEQLEQEVSAMSDEQVYCVIDPDTRQISVPAEYQLLGVESDEKVERIWFQCPKIVGDNIDLSQLQLRINYQNANSQKDQYIVTDVQTDGDNIVFSWLLSRKVTAYQGNVSFIVCAVKVSGETIQNEWNTTLATAKVLEGLEVDTPSPSEEQSDVIAQLLQIMTDTSEQAVSDVGTAKDAAIAAVQSQQSTSVQAIQTASSGAQTAIETKGNTVLESIPDDYTSLSETVEQLGRTKAPVIKKTVTGENIELEDAGSVPLQSIKLYGRSSQAKYEGKNLVEIIKTGVLNASGVTCDVNEDGTYTLNGTATKDVIFRLNQPDDNDVSNYPILFVLESGKKYRVIDCQLIKGDREAINGMSVNGIVYEPEEDENIVGVRVLINSGNSYDGKRIYCPGVWEDEEENDTEWEPYTGNKPSPSPEYPQPILSSSTENTGTGKHEVEMLSQSGNLFDASKLSTKTQGGATVTNNGDGSFTISGSGDLTGPFSSAYSLGEEDVKKIFKPGILYVETDRIVNPAFYVTFRTSEAVLATISTETNNISQLNVSDYLNTDGVYVVIQFNSFSGKEIIEGTTKPMVYQDGDGTYQPYGQSQATLSLTNPFAGIPVSSGGNYTDEDGQQYICDEIQADLEAGTGVYIQRISHVVFDGSEDEEWLKVSAAGNGDAYFRIECPGTTENANQLINFCTKTAIDSGNTDIGANVYLQASTGLTFFTVRPYAVGNGTVEEFRTWLSKNITDVYYVLAAPIITALTSEQIEALRQLQTYATITNITAGGDTEAGKEITYGADTKAYIDQKIAEIAQSLAATQNELLEV